MSSQARRICGDNMCRYISESSTKVIGGFQRDNPVIIDINAKRSKRANIKSLRSIGGHYYIHASDDQSRHFTQIKGDCL